MNDVSADFTPNNYKTNPLGALMRNVSRGVISHDHAIKTLVSNMTQEQATAFAKEHASRHILDGDFALDEHIVSHLYNMMSRNPEGWYSEETLKEVLDFYVGEHTNYSLDQLHNVLVRTKMMDVNHEINLEWPPLADDKHHFMFDGLQYEVGVSVLRINGYEVELKGGGHAFPADFYKTGQVIDDTPEEAIATFVRNELTGKHIDAWELIPSLELSLAQDEPYQSERLQALMEAYDVIHDVWTNGGYFADTQSPNKEWEKRDRAHTVIMREIENFTVKAYDKLTSELEPRYENEIQKYGSAIRKWESIVELKQLLVDSDLHIVVKILNDYHDKIAEYGSEEDAVKYGITKAEAKNCYHFLADTHEIHRHSLTASKCFAEAAWCHERFPDMFEPEYAGGSHSRSDFLDYMRHGKHMMMDRESFLDRNNEHINKGYSDYMRQVDEERRQISTTSVGGPSL